MKRRRIVILMHADLVPPTSIEGLSAAEVNNFKMEWDVLRTVEELGHEVRSVAVEDDLAPIRRALVEFKPHVVFNLLMHFHDEATYDSAVVSWLELRKQPYTGCNPRGLLIANDKALSKKVMSYHRIPAPRFFTVARGRAVRPLPKNLSYPLFVKSRSEHASTGIAHASIVRDMEALRERVEFIHRNVKTSALAEEYVEGQELTIAVLGNQRLETGPVWEVFFDNLPEGTPNIFTSRVKWDLAYQEKVGLRTGPTVLGQEEQASITRMAKRLYRALGLSGYARIDMRRRPTGELFVLEVNPNPDLCFGEDFAEAFAQVGYSYPELIEKILSLGIGYRAPWRE